MALNKIFRKEFICSKSITKIGCLDFLNAKDGTVYEDVAPLFYVKKVIRSIDRNAMGEEWLIYVNDHNQRKFDFRISSSVAYGVTMMGDLARYGVFADPGFSRAVASHLLYTRMECIKLGAVEYHHAILGWYPFEGVERYFYDVTVVGDKRSTTDRANLRFTAGDRKTYLDFLRETVLPSTELSLALTIGYGAVVASRLRNHFDIGTILVNLCGISSTGKSTAEMLLCSPFACPEISNRDIGLCFTANST